MIAHIRKSDGETQSLHKHSRNVSSLCGKSAEHLRLHETASLIGLLHDMGKASDKFTVYLQESHQGKKPSVHPTHAWIGAYFAYRRWFRQDSSESERLCAQMVAMCILGHHAGLCNVLDINGKFEFQDKLPEAPTRDYETIKSCFCENIAAEDELDGRFSRACAEIEGFIQTGDSFQKGLLMRLLLGILVDADRYDSACFEYGVDSLEEDTTIPDWNRLFETFETFRQEHLGGDSAINKIRTEISDICLQAAEKRSGIVTLTVPTGGGKTFSTLRYALKYAHTFSCKRIFYIIPFNTILDQNSRDIRKALDGYEGILEHHSNVVIEDENELQDYTRLTERWDSDIILTSLVRFLNACFKGKNSDARRFPKLTDSVLIFDEIQSLPKKCKGLFERAILFLTEFCGAQVVLCTATQPTLKFSTKKPDELMPNIGDLFARLSRVKYASEINIPRSNEDAASDLTNLLDTQSVLAVVNTKATASELYESVKQRLAERGRKILLPDCLLPKDRIEDFAAGLASDTVLCIHLTTLLCPEHRLLLIEWAKTFTRLGHRVFCISTALIEAGINLSFPAVVRSLAGLTSIVQAAGRCNRNMEIDFGKVYIWHLIEDNIRRLEDIRIGQRCTRAILSGGEYENGLDHPKTIQRYFEREEKLTEKSWDFPIGHDGHTLVKLLDENREIVRAYERKYDPKVLANRVVLKQSFRAAGEAFEVIPENTVSILVPFGEGEKRIAELAGTHSMNDRRLLLKKAQAYSVSVYEHTFQRLCEEGAVYHLEECGVRVLKPGYYSMELGVSAERGEFEMMEW